MQRDERRLLEEQLEQALAEVSAGALPTEPIEIATLGGLLQRELSGTAADTGARLLLDRALEHVGLARQALSELVAAAGVTGLLDDLTSISESDEPAQRADVLFELDEFLAAAWFCSYAAPELDEAADWVVRTIHATPELFVDLSGMATAVLSRHPELDPPSARMIWQAVEATRFYVEEGPRSLPACSRARTALGLDNIVSVHAFKPPPALRAADDALPSAPPWQTLERTDEWELALTLDESDQPIVLLSSINAELPLRVLRDEREVAVHCPRRGVRTWPAVPGSYGVLIGEEQHSFEVEP